MSDELSFRDVLGTGWKLTKERVGLWLGLLGTFLVVGVVNAVIQGAVTNAGVKVVIGLVFQFLQWYLTFNSLGVALAVVDGRAVSYADLWTPRGSFWFYVLASLLYGLIVFGGTLLLIVPGVIWGLMFMFYGYVMIENKVGPLEALRVSKKLTAGAKADLFLFGLLTVGLNILGLLFIGIGLIATLAITYFSMAYLYRWRTNVVGETPVA